MTLWEILARRAISVVVASRPRLRNASRATSSRRSSETATGRPRGFILESGLYNSTLPERMAYTRTRTRLLKRFLPIDAQTHIEGNPNSNETEQGTSAGPRLPRVPDAAGGRAHPT